MSKYTNVMNYTTEPSNPLVEGESLIHSTRPKKSAFMINQVLTMMPFALLWLAIDGTILGTMIASGELSNMLFFIIPFFAIHLFPVWIWLANVLSANKRWKNTRYYVTDKRIIIQNGFFAENYQTIYYKDIRNVNLRVGFIDNMLHVGDLYFDLGYMGENNKTASVSKAAFLDIENPREIYARVQKIVLDIQTDIEYPNALRPEENPGYNTKYRKY